VVQKAPTPREGPRGVPRFKKWAWEGRPFLDRNTLLTQEAYRRIVRSTAAVLGLLVLLGAGTTHGSFGAGAGPHATTPVLLTYLAVDGGLCAIRTDGSHPVRLTPRWRMDSIAWSPGGRFVAFSRATGPEQSKIFVANAGGRIRWRFGAGTNNWLPLWSPDGRRIEYTASWAHIGGLSVALRDGSNEGQIASSPPWPTYGPANPAWSADSRFVAYDDGNGVDLRQGIYAVDVESRTRDLLVPDARKPAYSPDGSSLAYTARGGIVIADVDGSNPRLLASSANDGGPVWSPDSKLIAFIQNGALIVTHVDGSGERVIASNASNPRWSPGGKLIAFVRLSDRRARGRIRSEIVVARTDGSARRVVVVRLAGSAEFEPPAWRPAAPLPKKKRSPCPKN